MQCIIPAYVAKSIKPYSELVESGQKKPVETSKQCTPIDETLAKKLIVYSRKTGAKVSPKDRQNNDGITLEAFIREAFKVSKANGFLTTEDVMRICNLGQVKKIGNETVYISSPNQSTGSDAFKLALFHLYAGHHLTKVDPKTETKIAFSDIGDDDIASIDDL